MALLIVLKTEIFKEAALNVAFRSYGREWDSEHIQRAADTLRKLAAEAQTHADATDAKTMEVIDSVIREFYPNHQEWNNPELLRLLLAKAEHLELCANANPVELDSLNAAFEFCKAMWVALSAFERELARPLRR